MRLLLASTLLLTVSIRADDAQLREPRAWRGTIRVRALSDEPEGGKGREEQTESAEFMLVTEPPRVSVMAPRLAFELRESEGSYALRIDTREPGRADGESVSVKGAGAGRLHLHAEGWFEPKTGKYRLELRADPDRLVALTTMSGIEGGRFQTFRHAESRPTYLDSFVAEGKVDGDGRTIRGERSFSDKSGALRRDVHVAWTLRRVDPAIEGRVVDHAGRPLEGVKILARTTNPERVRKRMPPILLEGVTDAAGRFRIDAFRAFWRFEVLAAVRPGGDPEVIAGREIEEGAEVRFDSAPDLEIALDVYRLAALPDAERLQRAFAGDAKRYLEFVRAKYSPEELRRALRP